MKKTLLFISVILICFTCFGQSGSRLVSFAGFFPDSTTIRDTCHYSYAPGRGGAVTSIQDDGYATLSGNPLPVVASYDMASRFIGFSSFDSAWRINETDTIKCWQNFNSNDNISNCLIQHSNGTTIIYNHIFSYDSEHRMTKWYDSAFVGSNASQIIYEYDTLGRLVLKTYQDNSYSGIWRNSYHYYYIYDNSGHLLVDGENQWNNSLSVWTDSTEILYHYTSGVLDSAASRHARLHGSSRPNYDHVYHYSPAGDTMITNVYNASNINYMNVTRVYDHHGNNISYSVIVPDTLITYVRSHGVDAIFNAYNQETSEVSYAINGVGSIGSYTFYRFHYESYAPTGTSIINEAEKSILIYPSPANSVVTIKLEWHEAVPFTITVYDVAGRLMKQWNEGGTNSFMKTLPVPEFPAGNYIVKASNGTQFQVGKFTVAQ